MKDPIATKQEKLKQLIMLGEERGYLTYADVRLHLPDAVDDEQLEGIGETLKEMNIRLYDSPPIEPQAFQTLSTDIHVTIATVNGKQNPVVMFDDELAAQLLRQWRIASAQAAALETNQRFDAVLKLCESLGRVMDQYVVTRNKFYGDQRDGERETVIAQLNELAASLKKLSGDNTDRLDFTCSFCGRDKNDVERMVQGATAMICGACIADCNEMVNEK